MAKRTIEERIAYLETYLAKYGSHKDVTTKKWHRLLKELKEQKTNG